MSKNEWKELVGVAGRMLLAVLFVFSQTAWAGQDQKTKDKADGAAESCCSANGREAVHHVGGFQVAMNDSFLVRSL